MTPHATAAADTASALHEIAFLRHVPVATLDEIVAMGTVEERHAGHIICRAGETTRSMYLILEGEVRVYRTEAGGEDVEIARLRAYDFFGELALFDDRPRSASVQCLTECRLFVLEQESFLQMLERYPGLVRGVISALTTRMREITEKEVRREQSLRTIRLEAELERHRSLGQLVAGVAHEINTPLGIANTAADIVASRLKRPEIAGILGTERATRVVLEDLVEACDLMQRNLQRAHKLVETFKHVAVNQLTERIARVRIPDTLREVVNLFALSAREARLAITIQDTLAEADDRIWIGYPGYLTQIVLNLLSNIQRYAYPDGQGGGVDIVLADGRLAARAAFSIAVTDRGAGIAPEHLAHVGEPFFTTGRARGGTGLGMAIVHNLVTDALHGTIHIDSALAVGTTVRIIVPREVQRTAIMST